MTIMVSRVPGVASCNRRWWCSRRDGDKKITYDGISALVSKLKRLRRINLQGNEGVSNKVLTSLSDNCPSLEEIVLKEAPSYGSRDLTHTGIGFALRSCERLKTVILHGNNSYPPQWAMDHICEALCCIPSLSKIEFHRTVVYDALLCAMAEAYLPSLESFTLSYCELRHRTYDGTFPLTDDGLLSFLKTYDSLDHLALEGVEFLSDVSMATLVKYLTKVRVVKLNSLYLSDSTLFNLIEQCPLLETVEMKNTDIGLGKEIAKEGGSSLNPQIRTLNLSSNEHLNDESLRRIALACPNLEKLELRSCHAISGNGVGNILRSCRSLKHLRIDDCPGVKNLDLERNTVYKLELLGASKSGIGDQALIDVSEKCPHLMHLNVKECKGLTSKGVKEVAHKCSKLKGINLERCKNVSSNILPWMVFCKPNLRKIVAPDFMGASEASLYLRHACDVYYDYY